MKILFQSRTELFDIRGGDTMQLEKTKEAIEKMESDIKIDISTKVQDENIEKYDIVHLFNLDWICETYVQSEWAKKYNKPIVLSAIHHSAKEIKLYEKHARYDIRRITNLLVPSQPFRDILKNIYRSAFIHQKIKPTLIQLMKGIRNTQREVLKNSSIVLVQTNVESEDIKKDFGYSDFRSEKVVNGIDHTILDEAEPDSFQGILKDEYGVDFRGKKIILNVGRIEPRKNQLRLIEAFNNLREDGELEDYLLVFIGKMGNRSYEYKHKFHKHLDHKKDIYYLSERPFRIVCSAMKASNIYVQPSWFETTGLVSLEAAYAGMKVVAAGDRVKEYLENYAEYCEPQSVESIENAILNTAKMASYESNMREKIRNEYTWQNTAKKTVEVYKHILKNL